MKFNRNQILSFRISFLLIGFSLIDTFLFNDTIFDTITRIDNIILGNYIMLIYSPIFIYRFSVSANSDLSILILILTLIIAFIILFIINLGCIFIYNKLKRSLQK